MLVVQLNAFFGLFIKIKYINENIKNKLTILFKNLVGHNVLFVLIG